MEEKNKNSMDKIKSTEKKIRFKPESKMCNGICMVM